MRRGYAGSLANSLIVNTGSQECLSLTMTIGESTPGHDTANNVAAGLNKLISTSCDDGAALTAGASALASTNGNAYALGETGLACSANDVSSPANGTATLVQEDPKFNPEGLAPSGTLGPALGAAYNPRPSAGAPVRLGCGVTPQDTGLDRAATYRGAFTTTAPELWTDGWTTLGGPAGLLK